MKNRLNKSELSLVKSLRKHGMILPASEDDLAHFEKTFKKDDIPPLPETLDNAKEIIKRGYVSKVYPTEVNNETTDDMARAAREGKEIPSDILKKMAEDRRNSRNDD